MFSSRMVRAREGGAGGSNGTAENKGPKGFFRCSKVSVAPRKVVAWVGMGLCVLAGEGRLALGGSVAFHNKDCMSQYVSPYAGLR